MKIGKYSGKITVKEVEQLKMNLDAFKFQFGFEPVISKYNREFYVYLTEEREAEDDYIQRCKNIDYLNGWLYGAVQTICGQIKKAT